MSVYNIYYSPTGGTKKVSDILANAMSDNVRHIDLLKKNLSSQHFEKEDICIISGPAFGGRVPADNIEKIKNQQWQLWEYKILPCFQNRNYIQFKLSSFSQTLFQFSTH